MARIDGMTTAAIDALMLEMVVSIRLDENGQMIYRKRSGEETNAGPVIAPTVALEKAWPIGSVYIGLTPENPQSTIGIGVWVRYGRGTVLVGQSDTDAEFTAVGQTGGVKSTKLTMAHVPQHRHDMTHNHKIRSADTDGGSTMAFRRTDNQGVSETYGAVISHEGDTAAAGSADPTPINNLPPYTVVYFWRRTA